MALAAYRDDNQPADHSRLLGFIKSPNIAEQLRDDAGGEETLSRMGERVAREYQIDKTSRADWETKTEQAMELAMQVAKEKQFPWPKASNVIYPLMTTASIQFAARAYPAIVQNRNVVKGVVVGSDEGKPAVNPQTGQPLTDPVTGQPVWAVLPGAKQARADRIGEHMSWQLLDEMPEWEPETDVLLHILPIVGCDFRKTYFDPDKQRNSSLRVSAKHLVINYKAKSMEAAPRLSEELQFYPLEIEEMFRAGLWIEPQTPFGRAANAQDGDDDAPHDFIEQHRTWDLDDDGYAEPYIVTIHKDSHQVVRVVARYDQESIQIGRNGKIKKIEPIHYYTKYDFLPNPDGGIYGIGFGQLLRPINEAINTNINQLIDAGTLQNTGGGFIGKGMSMNAGAIRFQLGEYKVVNTPGATVRDNIVPMQWPGPNQTLFELLGMLIDSGKEIAAIKDILTGEQMPNQNTPATTVLAVIEQGLKVFSAIYKRIHRALKSELNKLYDLNRKFGDESSEYKAGDAWKQIQRQDYVHGAGVEPISDPTMITDMQRLGRAQFLLQFANDPLCDPHEIRHRIMEAANIDNIDKVLLTQAPPNPVIAAKGMELEIKGQEQQARAQLLEAQRIQAYATAVNQLAMADQTVGDQHIQWLSQQLQVWEKQFDAATTPTPEGQSAPQGAAPPPPAMHHPLNLPPQATMPNSTTGINPHSPEQQLPQVQ